MDLTATKAKNFALAEDIAREAGGYLVDTWQSRNFEVESRGSHDVKLVADRNSEAIILQCLRRERPADGIISEESGSRETGRDGIWIIDPLDGTVNFSHGHPHFCVSIAWCYKGEVEVAAVYDPVRDEMFSAQRNAGACCNRVPVEAARTRHLNQAMLGIGYGNMPGQESLRQMEKLGDRVQKLRISGSAALDLAYVGCGRLDGYCESRIYVWDLAAGVLIASEAGAVGYIWPGQVRWRRTCLATVQPLAGDILAGLQLDPATAGAEWTA